MKNKTVIWNFYPIDELNCARNIGLDLFPGCEIRTDYYDKSKIDKDNFNIVIVDYFFHPKQFSRIKEDLSWADLVVHYTTEVIYGPWAEYKQLMREYFNTDKFISVCNGIVDMEPNDKIYTDTQTFFTRMTNCVAPTLTDVQPKEKLFDALLGKNDPCRAAVFGLLKTNQLLDKTFVNYYESTADGNATIYRSKDLDQHDEFSFKKGTIESVEQTKNGLTMSYSLPTAIYNNANYSIVTETVSPSQVKDQIGRTPFITEKTTKCLMGGRIFVMFGPAGTLDKLKQYGYKTFSSIIDESYDTVKDDKQRYKQAFQQVIKLAQLDPSETYANTIEVLRHNQNTLLDNRTRLENLRKFLIPYIE